MRNATDTLLALQALMEQSAPDAAEAFSWLVSCSPTLDRDDYGLALANACRVVAQHAEPDWNAADVHEALTPTPRPDWTEDDERDAQETMRGWRGE